MNDFVMNPEHYLGYKSMVRYETLTRLVNENYYGSNDEVIDLYIDLSSFIMSIMNGNTHMSIKDNLFISAWVINLCAHYRSFFKTRYNTYARIFLIYSDILDNGSIYRTICPEYTKETVNPTWANIIQMNTDILRNVCKYIGNVEFIRTKYEFGTKALYIINKNISNSILYPVMIISNDIINSQLCRSIILSGRLSNKITMLVPSKYKKDDKSYLLNQNNVLSNYICNYKNCSTVTPMFKSPEYISMLMALSGYNKRGYKSILSIRQAVNVLNDLYINGVISDDNTNLLFSCVNGLLNRYHNKRQYSDHISNRFKTLNFNYQLLGLFVDELDIDSYIGMTNLYNNQALYEIIDRLFKNYEIDLMSL